MVKKPRTHSLREYLHIDSTLDRKCLIVSTLLLISWDALSGAFVLYGSCIDRKFKSAARSQRAFLRRSLFEKFTLKFHHADALKKCY